MYWIPVILILPYLVILLKIYRGLLKIETFNSSVDPLIFVSVVIACHNEQKNLPKLLESISKQNYPENLFELIIIDDNSTDKTLEIAEDFSYKKKIVILNNSGKGKKKAIRSGITASKGTLIITTDADCIMGSNWMRTIAAFYEFNKPEMIVCPVKIESATGFFGRFQELEFISLQGITAGSALMKKATMCNGANLAFTREAYLEHSQNLHDEINSGDDIFLLQSLKNMSRSKILWLESSDVMVTTKGSSTFNSFLKQRSRWFSKVKSYKDLDIIVLGIFTFVVIVLQVLYFIALLFYPVLTLVFLAIFILKSVPDFLILMNTSYRYGRKKLMWWFLPAQLIYPFYVLSVVLYSLTLRKR
jgi:cellulose synthase/poly-beta-1,6-N-acetylglucosamine synthase-like glycosyltransferase